MNFGDLRDFDWQAVASILTFVAVAIALWTTISNSLKMQVHRRHISSQIRTSLATLLFRLERLFTVLDEEKKGSEETLNLPQIRRDARKVHDLIEEKGHFIRRTKIRKLVTEVDIQVNFLCQFRYSAVSYKEFYDELVNIMERLVNAEFRRRNKKEKRG